MLTTPAEQIIDTLNRCEDGMQHQACPDQHGGETMPEYASRVLGYALRYGIGPLTASQLDLADATAQGIACSHPKEMDPDQARLDQTIHTLRLQIQREQLTRRARLTALQRLFDQMDATPSADLDAPQGNLADERQESDADRAARLLKAALMLIMGPGLGPGNGGGGRPARLQPPPPDKGPGSHADSRPTPPPVGRRF